jgi:predicted CopG family antitoxin
MAILQLRDIDDNLYEALKTLAKKERRSISQEVIMMIESYINNPKRTAPESTEEFLNLSWHGSESADEIINSIRKQRKNSISPSGFRVISCYRSNKINNGNVC